MGRRGPTDHFIMTKNNYFHMKLREHREEIARLKEELEDSAKAALERESATAGMAAEQIDREKAAARVERERVLTQLESVEADRDEGWSGSGSPRSASSRRRKEPGSAPGPSWSGWCSWPVLL